jgi:hypothetical protein
LASSGSSAPRSTGWPRPASSPWREEDCLSRRHERVARPDRP